MGTTKNNGVEKGSSLDSFLLDRKGLSESQKAIADYLCKNPWEGLAQTSAEIGAAVGVSASTVVRFAQSIGFNGLAELQQLLASHVKHMLRSRESIERVKFVHEQLGLQQTQTSYDVFLGVAKSEIDNIERTRKFVSADQFNAVVEQLTGARNLYVLGLRGSLGLAIHFTVGMRYVRPNVFRLDNSGDDLPDKLASLEAEDCLVAFSYSPYTSTTVEVVKTCHSLGIPVVLITDSDRSPSLKYANYHLITSNPLWFSSTTAGTAALVNSLVYAAAAEAKKQTTAHTEKAQQVVAALEKFELSNLDNLLGILWSDGDERPAAQHGAPAKLEA